MNTRSEVLLSIGLVVGFFSIAVMVWIFQSSIERDVWNKCHPELQLTLWETMWSTTRIDNCGP